MARCKAEQEKDDNPNRPGYCRAVCKGKIRPAELTILKLEDLEKNDMAPKNDKRGKCESCGEVNLQLHPANDKQMCGKCRTIYSNAKNWLPIIESALADIYPEKYGISPVSIDDKDEQINSYWETMHQIRLLVGASEPTDNVVSMIEEYVLGFDDQRVKIDNVN